MDSIEAAREPPVNFLARHFETESSRHLAIAFTIRGSLAVPPKPRRALLARRGGSRQAREDQARRDRCPAETAAEPALAQQAVPNASVELLTDPSAEHAQKVRDALRSTLDKDLLSTRKDSLRKRLGEAQGMLDPDAPDWLPGLLVAFDQGFADLKAAQRLHATAVPGQQRYSAETKALTKGGFDLATSIRKSAGARLLNKPSTNELREQLGIGVPLTATAPLEVLAVLHTQHAACTDEKVSAMMRTAGIVSARYAAPLALLAERLERSINEGVHRDHHRGEALEEVNAALLKIESPLAREHLDERVRRPCLGEADGDRGAEEARQQR